MSWRTASTPCRSWAGLRTGAVNSSVRQASGGKIHIPRFCRAELFTNIQIFLLS
jgi:hypothetical protein